MRIRKGEIREGVFKDISRFLRKNDVLVLNESKVFPARIFGKKDTGGKVEILLLKNLREGVWEVMTKPGLKKGQKIVFEEKLLGEVKKGQENELTAKIEFNQKEVAERLNLAKKQGKRIIAVGTTSLRALESMSDQKGHLRWGSKETEIFIYQRAVY